MKELDDFLVKVGTDKILHHVVGALVCALVSFVVILQEGVVDWRTVLAPTIGVVFVLFISVIKELFLDESREWKDVVWAMTGTLWVYAAVAIGVLFNYLSR